MPEMVGAFNTPPVYTLGLAQALADLGLDLEEISDPLAWLQAHRRSPVLVAVRDTTDLDVVVDIKTEAPDSIVVTIVDRLDVDSIEASLGAGATSSVDVRAPAGEVILALSAAMTDHTVLPAGVARSIITARSRTESIDLSDQDRDTLRSLAQGATVLELAARLGYSEREMYRRLRRLYTAMGATCRTDALLRAARCGLLE